MRRSQNLEIVFFSVKKKLHKALRSVQFLASFTTIPAKSFWPPSEESPPLLPLFQCCYNDVDFSFDIFLHLQNNIGQGVWGKSKPLSNVIV